MPPLRKGNHHHRKVAGHRSLTRGNVHQALRLHPFTRPPLGRTHRPCPYPTNDRTRRRLLGRVQSPGRPTPYPQVTVQGNHPTPRTNRRGRNHARNNPQKITHRHPNKNTLFRQKVTHACARQRVTIRVGASITRYNISNHFLFLRVHYEMTNRER